MRFQKSRSISENCRRWGRLNINHTNGALQKRGLTNSTGRVLDSPRRAVSRTKSTKDRWGQDLICLYNPVVSERSPPHPLSLSPPSLSLLNVRKGSAFLLPHSPHPLTFSLIQRSANTTQNCFLHFGLNALPQSIRPRLFPKTSFTLPQRSLRSLGILKLVQSPRILSFLPGSTPLSLSQSPIS